MQSFNNLSTVKFQSKLAASAADIYNKIFPIKEIIDLRGNDDKPHVLDQEFAIDKLLILKTGHWISVQEKYRTNKFLNDHRFMVKPPTPDFTQEYKNGNNTLGEWFKLAAQLYFYGWSNKSETNFEKWVIIDIVKYKIIIENLGGIEKIGTYRNNQQHGSAGFYCFPITLIKDAFLYTYKDFTI